MSEVLDVFVQSCSSTERWDEGEWGPGGSPKGKSFIPSCRENPVSQYHSRSYRNPTQVDSQNMARRSR